MIMAKQSLLAAHDVTLMELSMENPRFPFWQRLALFLESHYC